MNRAELGVGAVLLSVGLFIGIGIALSMWQVTIAVWQAVPFFDPMLVLVYFLTTWIMTTSGCILMVDGFRRTSRLPTVNVLSQMPTS